MTYLKGVESLVRIHLTIRSSEAIDCQLLDLRQDVAFVADILAGTVFINVFLKLFVAKFVTRLKLAVVLRFLLHRIVRQVHHSVGQVI